MADSAIDTLLGGLGTVGQAALAVPQAIGGTALDVLIGDRTNVPVGEQVKRSIESLLLMGDNPANLIAVHNMYAKQDAANQTIVSSPDFQRAMAVNQVAHGLEPMDAFQYTAKQYGVSGYSPNTQQQAVDLAPGGPSAPVRQTVPILPPPPTTDVAKSIEAGTKVNAYTIGSPEDQAAARYQGAGIAPPLWLQRSRGEQAIGSQTPGTGTIDVNWNGQNLGMSFHELKPDEKTFTDPAQALDAVHWANVGSEAAGSATRYHLLKAADGTYSMGKVDSAQDAARFGVTGKAIGEATPLPELGGFTPEQQDLAREQQRRVNDYAAQLAYEQQKKALDVSTPPEATRAAAAQTVKESSVLSTMIDQYLAALKPENVGAVGDFRQLKYGIAAQNQAFANLQSQTLDSMAENNLRPGTGKGIERAATYFDPSLSTAEVLGNAIAYRLARILDPSSKVSDADLINQKNALGLDRWFGNDQDIAARMLVMKNMAEKQGQIAQGILAARPTAPAAAPFQPRPIITRPPASTGAPTAPQASTGDPDLDAVLRRGR